MNDKVSVNPQAGVWATGDATLIVLVCSPVMKLDCVDLVFCGTALLFVLLIKLSRRQIPQRRHLEYKLN